MKFGFIENGLAYNVSQYYVNEDNMKIVRSNMI